MRPLAWPQTIELLCTNADVLRELPDCVATVGPQVEMWLLDAVSTMTEIDGAVAAYSASSPAGMRAAVELLVVTAADELARQTPDPEPFDVAMAQTFGVAAYLAVIETQCPERFADAGDVAHQVIADYDL